jgi:hypothetical protein
MGSNQKIINFFSEYENRFQEGIEGSVDIEKTASAFANFFVEARKFLLI